MPAPSRASAAGVSGASSLWRKLRSPHVTRAQAGYLKRGESLFLAQSGFARVVQFKPSAIAPVPICSLLVVGQIDHEFPGLHEPR